jgi:hypothetical protein
MPTSTRALRKRRRELSPGLEKLVAIRNRKLAHNDPRIALGSFRKDLGGLSFEEIDGLLAHAKELVDRYQSMFRATISATQFPGSDDYKSLLMWVEKALAQDRADLEAEITAAGRRPAVLGPE